MDKRLQLLLELKDKITAPLRGIAKGSSDTAKALAAARDQLKTLNNQQAALEKFGKSTAALREGSNQLKVLRQNLQMLQATGQGSTAQAKQLQAQLDKQTGAFKKQQATVLQLRSNLSRLGITNVSQAQQRMGADIAAATAKIEAQKAALQRLGAQQKRVAALKAQHSKAMMHSGMAAATGVGMQAVGQNAGRKLGSLLAPGLEFDAQMSKVQALARLDKQSAEYAQLRAQALQLGASTMFSATEAAQGQGFLAMAGFDPKAIQAAMPGLLDMAKAGDIDLARTADISSNILSGFGIDPAEMGRVSDVLTKTFTTANVNLEMLGDTMSYVAPVARAAGVDLETTAAMAGLLGNVGIQGQKGGTALRAMLLRLAAPTGGAAKMLKKLGVQTRDAKGNVLGVTDVLTRLAKQTEKLGSAQRMEALKAIFGEEPAAAMAELIEKSGSGGITEYLAKVQDSAGAAKATAATMADNMRGDIDELSSAWEDVRIQIFDANNGEIRAWTQKLTQGVQAVGNWFKANPLAAKWLVRIVAGFAALTFGIGALLVPLALLYGKAMLLRFAFGMVGVKLPGLIGMFKGVGAAVVRFGPLLARFAPMLARLLGPVGLLITAGTMLYNNWDDVVGGATLLWQDACAALASIWGGLKNLATGLWQSIVSGVQNLLHGGVAQWAQVLLNFSPFGLLWQAFTAALAALGIQVPAQFKTLGGFLIDGLIGGITARLGALKDAIVNAAASAGAWFKEKLGIHSPSRVFMQYGDFIGQGAALGIEKSRAAVGTAALALASTAALPMQAQAMAPLPAAGPLAPITAPLAAPRGAAPAAGAGAAPVNITINAAPGMDTQALARAVQQAVQQELQRRDRASSARRQSALYDLN